METQTKNNKLRKFSYLVLCAVLGVIIFVFIEQLFLNLLSVLELISEQIFDFANSLGAIVALAVGAWYGVWLGSYWYEKVYGNASTGGFISHVTNTLSKEPGEDEDDEGGAWKMDDLFKSVGTPAVTSTNVVQSEPEKPLVVKRVRKAAVKKVNSPSLQSTTTKKTLPTVPVKKRTVTRKKAVPNQNENS